jgi:hypothetical protein
VVASFFLPQLCYDDLAGRLGVGLAKTLIKTGAVTMNENDFDCPPGHDDLWATLGINLDDLRKRYRKFAPRCIDWSEREPHIAGALGMANPRGYPKTT